MRYLPLVIGAVTAFAAGSASAQSVNLTGNYRCVQDCRDGNLGGPAFVTQNGDSLNLVTETGNSFRAWPDVTAPTSRIWIDARNESAVYSPDGLRIQFDDGRIWVRDFGPPPPPPGVVVRRRPVAWVR
jgi:hypothetical protein